MHAMRRSVLDDETERLVTSILDGFHEVRRELGPGLAERAYRKPFFHELERRGHVLEIERPLRLHYKGVAYDESFRADLVVDRLILVELKATEATLDVHFAQTLTYLRLSGLPLALLLNFGVLHAAKAVRRILNDRVR